MYHKKLLIIFLSFAFALTSLILSVKPTFASNIATKLVANPQGCGSTGKVTVNFVWTPADNYQPGNIAPLDQWLDYALTSNINGAFGTPYFGNKQVAVGEGSVTLDDTFAPNIDYWWRVNTNWGGFLGGWASSQVEHFNFNCDSKSGPTWNNPGRPAPPFNLLDVFQPARRFGSFGQLASDILLILVGLAGALALIFIIMSGIKMATSSGDEKRLASARSTLTYAIIGVIVVIIAFVIIQVVQYFLQSSVPITR